MKSVQLESLDPTLYREIVERALKEDLGRGDVTTKGIASAELHAKGIILAKSHCILAGLDVTAEVFRQLDAGSTISYHYQDGACCQPGDRVAEITGLAAALLTAERTALNFLQRLSGIATLTRSFVEASEGIITVLDTRKTMPTFRVLEKYAVRAGGGTNHRTSLDDQVLIKDNHLKIAGGMKEAIRLARAANHDMPIEVEAKNLIEVEEALEEGVSTVLVDNMTIEDIREAVRRSRGRASIEISGGVTLDQMPQLAKTGAEYISVGLITHSAPAADFSFEMTA